METTTTPTTTYPKHACQKCGSERKWVGTIIDDEFIWNENTKEYEANGFSDEFEHNGQETCVECGYEWTGE